MNEGKKKEAKDKRNKKKKKGRERMEGKERKEERKKKTILNSKLPRPNLTTICCIRYLFQICG